MATKKKLLQAAAGAAGGEALNIEDVFSTYLYDGNSSTQTITNGIDLSGEGGLVWIKSRNGSNQYPWIFDTERGATKLLNTSTTWTEGTTTNSLTQFNSNGFSVGSYDDVNNNAEKFASWTFRKAPKFFDVVTWTGDGTGARTISHNLGSTPGSIIRKKTSGAERWYVWHRSVSNDLSLNETTAASYIAFNLTDPTSTEFTVSSSGNISGETHVAYLFAHNDGDGEFGPDADQDIIKCGSYTTDASADATINLGWEPQWVMFRPYDDTSNWKIVDNMRGFVATAAYPTYNQQLAADTSGAEAANDNIQITSTGFDHVSGFASKNFIYIAIRRGPMAVPTDATDVFAMDNLSPASTPRYVSNFVTDFALWRSTSSDYWKANSRLQGIRTLYPSETWNEDAGSSTSTWDWMDGFGDGYAGSLPNDWAWMWKRAPNFFDVVAYTGTGSARTVSHNLGVAPEMIWVKPRETGLASSDWWVFHKDLSTPADDSLVLNSTGAENTGNGALLWNSTMPTSSVFSLGSYNGINQSGRAFIAYLFASLDGVSKVGSFSHTNGNGDTNVDCGFSSGARFVLYKQYDSSGSWYVLDSTRGIVAGNDPALLLNSNAAQDSSYDQIDPYSSGFTIPSDGVGTGDYIFYAIA